MSAYATAKRTIAQEVTEPKLSNNGIYYFQGYNTTILNIHETNRRGLNRATANAYEVYGAYGRAGEDVIIVDRLNYVIRKVNATTGSISTVAGTGLRRR